MALPDDLLSVVLRTTVPLVLPDGTPMEGYLRLTAPDLVVVDGREITGGSVRADLTAGQLADDLALVPTSGVAGMSPAGWTYRADLVLTNGPGWRRDIELPAGTSPVELAALVSADPSPGTYTVLAPLAQVEAYADAGDAATLATARAYTDSHGAGSPATTVVAGTSYGQASAAGTAATYSRGDHTHGTPPAPTAAGIGALAASNNLSDVVDAAASRGHLGLGTAALASTAAFDAAGAAASAQSAATTAAAGDATAKVIAHVGATDPHGDRAAASAALGAHAAATTAVHGIPDTSALVTTTSGDGRYVKQAALDTAVAYPPAYRLPRYSQPAVILTEWQSGHGYTASGGTLSTDTAVFVRGTQCVRYVSPGDGATYNITGAISSTDTTGRALRLLVRVEDITVLQSLDVQVAVDSSFASGWTWTAQGTTGTSTYLTSGDWVLITLGFADATALGAGARSGLTALRVRVRDTGAPVTVRLQAAELVVDGSAAFPSGVVVLTADDVYQSFVDLGAAKLDAYGYPVTAYVIADRVGLSGRLTLAEMQDRQATAGWELACHAYSDTVHGLTYSGVSAAQVDADARAMKGYAVLNGFRAADHFALPKGATARTTDGQPLIPLLQRYFTSVASTVNKTRETFPPSDPFRIRRISAISSFTGGYAPASITGAGGDLDRIKAAGGVLVLNFHQIVSASPADTSQILQSDFTAIIDAIASKGIPVLTMGELMRYALTSSSSGAAVDSVSIPKRAAAVGTPGASALAAPADHAHPRTTWEAADHGLLTWLADPALCQNSQTPASGAGVLQLVRLHLPVAATVSSVCLYVSTAGSGLTSGQCWAGLYSTAGALLSAVSADQSTAWASVGLKSMALATPQSCAAGDYYVGWFANGTTLPAFLRAVGSSAGNAGLAAASARFATGATGQTTAAPASAGTLAGSSAGFWAALA